MTEVTDLITKRATQNAAAHIGTPKLILATLLMKGSTALLWYALGGEKLLGIRDLKLGLLLATGFVVAIIADFSFSAILAILWYDAFQKFQSRTGKYPKYAYLCSGDPMHYSHVNTKQTAEALFGRPVAVILCRNELKGQSLFTMEERKKIAQRYFPGEEIYIASTRDEIRAFIANAKVIFRGYREPANIEDDRQKAITYGVEDQSYKLFFLPVVDELHPVCSSRLKELVSVGRDDEVKNWAPEWLIDMVRIKLTVT